MLFLRSFILNSTFIFFGFSFRSFFYYWCQLYLYDVLQFSSLLVFNSFRNLMFYDLFILESTFLLLGFGFRSFLLLMSIIFIRRITIFKLFVFEFISQFLVLFLPSFYFRQNLSFVQFRFKEFFLLLISSISIWRAAIFILFVFELISPFSMLFLPSFHLKQYLSFVRFRF